MSFDETNFSPRLTSKKFEPNLDSIITIMLKFTVCAYFTTNTLDVCVKTCLATVKKMRRNKMKCTTRQTKSGCF